MVRMQDCPVFADSTIVLHFIVLWTNLSVNKDYHPIVVSRLQKYAFSRTWQNIFLHARKKMLEWACFQGTGS